MPITLPFYRKFNKSARRASKKHNSAFYLEKFKILRKESKALINRKLEKHHTSVGDFMSSAIKPNQILYQLMLRKEGHRSPLERRWQKPLTSISLLRLRMRPRYPLMRLRHSTRGCPSLTAWCCVKMRSIRCS